MDSKHIAQELVRVARILIANKKIIAADPKQILKTLRGIKVTMAEAAIGRALNGKTFRSLKDIEKELEKFQKPEVGYNKVFVRLQFDDGEINGFRYDHGRKDSTFTDQLEYYIKNYVTVTIED